MAATATTTITTSSSHHRLGPPGYYNSEKINSFKRLIRFLASTHTGQHKTCGCAFK
jgi:hypothetical protein